MSYSTSPGGGVTADIHYVPVDGGRIASSTSGSGPLVILSPGMGDLRTSYRFQVPTLTAAGYRAVSVDLRGHGDSDTTFLHYGDEPTSEDLASVIESYGGPAVIVGNSMSAGAAVITAARRPELVSGLVLVGPFVRTPRTTWLQKMMMSVLMSKPLVVSSWSSYLPKLFAGHKPADFDSYRASVKRAMARPGYREAFMATMKTSHDAAESSLSKVSAPTLVVMGSSDPDFPNPEQEARWIGHELGARVELLADAGHYPHAQQPEGVNALLLDFLKKVTADA
jgi:pimeloyl-ACP methyl ester carboxylesterase